MARKSKSSFDDIEVFMYILLAIVAIPIVIILGLVKLFQKIRLNSNTKSINQKIQTLNLYKPTISNSNLTTYITKIKDTKIYQNSSFAISFNDTYFSFCNEQGSSDTLNYKNVNSLYLVASSDYKKLFLQSNNVKIPFNINNLSGAEELYKILLNILEINKGINESETSKLLSPNNTPSYYDKKIDKLEQKKDIINGFIEKYKVDIFALIEDLGTKVFRFDSDLYSLIEGNKIFDYYKAKDKFPYYCWNGADETIKEILFFLNSLKKRLQNDWDSKETLDTVVYIVFRNSIVEYYAKYFKSNYSSSDFSNTLLELSDKELIIYKMSFVCNYVVEKGIKTPLYTTYLDLSKEINQTIDKIRQERKEAKMFRNSEKGATQKDTTTEIPNENIDTEIAVTETKPLEVIDDIDQLTGEEFEKYIGEYFRSIGYKVIVTPLSGDYGVDIIIENELVKIGVQAKRYANTVGNSAIQEVVAGMKHYNLDKGMVITNNYFSRSAIALAKDNNIVLWDRDTVKVKFSKK